MAKIPEGVLPIINPGAFNAPKTESKKTRDKSSLRGIRKPQFDEILETTVQELGALGEYPASDETVEMLLDTVYDAGDALKDRPFPEEIVRYKRAVRDFLHYVAKNGYAVLEQEGIPNYLRPGWKGRLEDRSAQRPFVTIQVVDEKLEALALGLVKNQIKQVELLARIEEIKGLLIDLLE
jgi:uncharacterized protein YaaR (DUF327 family)